MRESEGSDRDPIYLDGQATTPCDPAVVAAMGPCFAADFGNPASLQHAFGRRAAARVDRAREQVANLLGCEQAEIVFTSGATEADNLALLGVAEAEVTRESVTPRRHLITCTSEHKAVLDACASLERRGFEITYLGIEPDGRLRPESVAAALRPDTLMVSLMMANNEIGVLHPLREISTLCRERNVLLHTDAAQAPAVLDCRVDELGVDLLSVSGHKIYGPKGVGALYLRRRRPRVRIAPQSHGGGHERGRRSGTLPVSAIVGFGVACELANRRRVDDAKRLGRLRDRLLERLLEHEPDLVVNGCLEHRLPHNLNVSLSGVDALALLAALDGVAISSGSACTSSALDGSYVVRLLEGGEKRAQTALRFGLLRTTTEADVARAAAAVVQAARAVRQAPPVTADLCAPVCAA